MGVTNSSMSTEKPTEFIYDDSEIPDLVLETIIEFLAKETPIEQWNEIKRVSKRWNRLSKPIFREVFKNAWPKFILPRNRETAVEYTSSKVTIPQPSGPKLSFNKSLDEVTLSEFCLIHHSPS